jgi:hypothetical protein
MTDELLDNGDFTKGWANNWEAVTNDGTLHKYLYPQPGGPPTLTAFGIQYETREPGKKASIATSFTIDPTRNYQITGLFKTQDIVSDAYDAGAEVSITWKDTTGRELARTIVITRYQGTRDWTTFQHTINPATDSLMQPGSIACRGTLYLTLNDCSGTVWFESLSILPI